MQLFIFIFSLTLLFLIFTLLIYFALNNLFKFQKITPSELKFSVIVAAKNEEENIPNLISALKQQSYDSKLFEVIIVDDNSTDNTFDVAKSATTNSTGFKVIKAYDKTYDAKKGALDIGIKYSSNPYIVITDADCLPSANWLKAMAKSFNSGNDFVFGIAPFFQTNSIINKISSFENLRSQIIMFALAKLGFPYSASARSFGFTKSAFEKISGYKNTTETLSGDDDLLLREAVKHNLKIGLCSTPNAFVYSNTKSSYAEYVKQKLRHTSTSLHYSLMNKIILGIWHLINIVLVVSALLTFISSVFILPVFLKIMLDLFLINSFQRNFGYRFNPFEMLFLQIIYEFQLIYFFIFARKYSTRW